MLQNFNNLILFFLLSFSLVACNPSPEKEANNDVTPSGLSYDPRVFDLEKNTPLDIVAPTVTGTNLTFAVSPALPSGIFLNSREGYLSGIPRAVSLDKEYIITASNSKGSITFKINLKVRDKILPAVSYPQNRYSFMIGTNAGVINPITQGAIFVRYEIDPALPAGLNFNTNTGQITGTPQNINSNSYHSVNAYISDSLFVSTSISFELNDIPPQNLFYNPSSIVLQKNTTMTPVLAGASGGMITEYLVAPALPLGLIINSSTGVISGTPTVVRPASLYTVTAKNSGGSTATVISIQIKDLPPVNLSYGTSTIISTRTAPLSQITPTYGGGSAESFSIAPALPAGLNFNNINGAISGTPSVVQASKSYTVTVSNSGGSSSVVLNLVVKDLPPQNLSYPLISEIFIKNTPIQSLTPTVQGGAVSSYSVMPVLPAGLNLDISSGIISGTPTVILNSSSYTVMASNSEGNSSYSFFIAIKDEAPQNLRYPSLELVLEKGTAMVPATPSSEAGAIKTYSLAPILPTGLLIESTTGIIRGTPSIVADRAKYTVTGSNPTGSTSRDIFITVNDKPPVSLNYGQTNFTFERGIEIPSLIPSNIGGDIIVYTVDPELPRGLSLDVQTGIVSGTPLDFQGTQNYTITGSNTGGSSQNTISISINNYPPERLAYSSVGLITLKKNIPIALPGIIPTYSGGEIINFYFDPNYPVPAGISLDSTTGYLSGTPTQKNNSPQLIKIIGSNTGGQTTSDLQIRVLDEPPVLTIATTEYVFQRATAISLIKPTVSGGTPTSYLLSTTTGELNPPLPPGLTFNSSTGAVTGTPSAEFEARVYGITGVNEGGDSSIFISLRVTEIPPSNISYGNDLIEVIRDQHNYTTGDPTPYTPVSFVPTHSGGPVVTWSITPALPTGLNFNASTGAITGIPLIGTPLVTYTISATNSGGTGTKILNFKVKDLPPTNLAYESNTFVRESADDVFISSPSNAGGFITAYSITPGLPSGLSFNTTTGEITKVSNLSSLNTTSFTITGSNAEGSTSTVISIQLNPSAPQDLKYVAPQGGPEGILYFTLGNSSLSYSPTNGGGLIDGCVINGTPNPAYKASNFAYLTEGPNYANDNRDLVSTAIAGLPSGLSFNSTTGILSGAISSTSNYKYQFQIDGCNAGGATVTYAFIVVNRRPIAVTIPTVTTTIQTLTSLNALGTYDPDDDSRIIYDADPSKNIKGTKVISYEWKVISKPVGSSVIDSSITNRLLQTASFFPDKIGTYTFSVIAKDDLASSTAANVSVTVKDVAPSNLSYGASDYGFDAFVYNVGQSMSISPTNNGGQIVTYSVTPSLPSGLNLSPSTGIVSGTTTAAQVATNYTIQGCNTGGCSTMNLKIWINAAPVAAINGPNKSNFPGLISLNASSSTDADRVTAESAPWNLVPTTVTYQWNVVSKPLGSVISMASFSNPAGVSTTINPDKKGTYVFSLIVNDGLIDSLVQTKTIKVGTAPSGLSYGSALFGTDVFVYTKNKETVSLIPSASGDAPDSYSISPSLPSGLSFNPTTGVISGVATSASAPSTYTILASNNGGDSSVNIKLWINEYPIADAGLNSSNIVVGNSATLNASASYDVDSAAGGVAPFTAVVPTFTWDLIGLPPTSITTSASILNRSTKIGDFVPDAEGIYVFKFTYYDYFVYSPNFASTQVITQTAPSEKRPIADAGSDISAATIGTYSLDASNSEVFNGTISYYWELINSPTDSISEITDPALAEATINLDMEGSYILKLTVSDGILTDTDYISLYVTGTEVTKGGGISSDEIWTRAESPIKLTSNVTVTAGAKITVEPGVVILGEGRSLSISNGSVEMVGSITEPIFINNLFIQRTSSGSAGITLSYVEMDSGGVCTAYACTGQVIITNSILKGLTGTAKITDSTEITRIENSVLINSHGFELSTTGTAMSIKNNYIYNMQGAGAEKFFVKVTKDQNSVIQISDNWFVNLDSRKIISHTATQDTNIRKNYWQNSVPILSPLNITPMFSNNVTKLLIEPFYTFPPLATPSGKKYLP